MSALAIATGSPPTTRSVIWRSVSAIDVAGARAAVARRDDDHLVGVLHLGVRVEDVQEQVLEVGAVRTGQVGTDRAAFAVHLVARAAGALEDRPSAGGVGTRHRLVVQQTAVARVGPFLGGG